MNKLSFTIIISPDSYLLRSELESMRVQSKGLQDALEVLTFWGDEGLPDSFWEHLVLQGLFSLPKLLIIRNAQNIPAASLKELSNAFARSSATTMTVLCFEVPFEKGKPKIPAHIIKLPWYIYAQKHRAIKTLAGLTQNSMPQFLQSEASRLGIRISPAILSRLLHLLPIDAAQIASELEKLSLTADASGQIPEHALSLIEKNTDANIFDMLRSVQTGSGSAAVWKKMADDHLAGENLIFSFLAVLTREARVLWQLLMGETPALPPQVIAAKKSMAHSLGVMGIAKLWELALEADKSIKSGGKSPEQAFELLTADLFLLFKRSSSSP